MTKRNQYDITVDATIIDVSKKPSGIYRVKTTGAEFEVYATAGSYYKNDIVLVQIPNGDYKNPKFILGRKEDLEQNKTFSFKLPFDDFIGLLYLNENNNFSGAYWANYPKTTQEQYDQLTTKVWSWENKEGSTIGNTRLGIEADWQTFLGEYYPLRGSYGFRIIVKGVTASTEATAATEIEREYYFTNADMYGNPYAYYSLYNQQKVLDVSEFLNIHNIDIYFYQDYNFADSMNTPIQYEEENGVPVIPENIIFDNVNIYLGVSAEDIKDETTFLYSYNALSYSSKETRIDEPELGIHQIVFICDEVKQLYFTWVHYEPDGTFSVIKDVNDLARQRNKAGKKTHVYWYRYNYEATEEEMIWKPEHAELEKDWNDSMNNPNYETQIERYGGPHWTFLPYATDDFAIEFTPRGDKSREKFKVVVQHDGTHTVTEERVFKNTRDVEAELLAGAKNDAIVIKCYKLQKIKNAAGQWTGEYEAVEDGSINAFHVYDENNTILYNDDNERFDEHEYYLQIHFRNEDTNLYEILNTIAENGTNTGSSIAWAFPRSYSMIKSTMEVTPLDAEYFGIKAGDEPIRFQNFHNATIKFSIQSIYNNRYLDNTVGAIINQNGQDYHIEKNLMFGRAEGLGHEFLPIIEIVEPVGDTYLHIGTEFQIACAVYNKDGSLFENPNMLTFTWRELSGQCEFYHADADMNQVEGWETGSYIGDNKGYREKYEGYYNNVVRATLVQHNDKNTPPPIFEVTVNGAAAYPLVVRKGFMICNDYTYKQPRDVAVPSRVEFKSDGADPIFYSDYFEVAELTSGVGITANYKVEYPTWQISNDSIFHLESKTTQRSTIERNNGIVSNDVNRSYTQYKLVFNTDGNPQWLDEYLDPNSYTYIYYKYNTNGLNIYLAQALAFDRNYYASSLVNDWDGTSLTWDEDNGAILSTMIAAGAKDGNNKFTGVMMGDWHAKGDESLDTPGLYGYNKGAQTFGFKTDGTGFIGGSGKGRIEFDGNEAIISNPDRSCYINLNPISFSKSFEDLNNQSFSQNFIYCQVEKTDNLFDSISNSIAGRGSWAQKYFNDPNHEYFIVDPNYGVLTTGGIVARYGALGNWMISNEGLYQKTDNSYMYLGFDDEGSKRHAIYIATTEPNISGTVMPYFSVDWQGTMFARKGLIANTWTIDDYALTYKKNYDILYLGTEGYTNGGKKTEGTTYEPKGRAVTLDDSRRWAISGSNNYNPNKPDDPYLINFGVSLSGELYSQLGTIGGWKISETQLYAANGKMIFDAENSRILVGSPITVDTGVAYPIMIDGETGLMSIVGTGNSEVTRGYLYLANFTVEAISNTGTWQYPFAITQVNGASKTAGEFNLENTGYNNSNSWDGGTANGSIGVTIGPLNYIEQETTKSIATLTSSNTFNIVTRDNGGNYGLAIATGITSDNKKTTVVYPVNCDTNYPSLGMSIPPSGATTGSEYRWNVYANILDCNSLNTAGNISAFNMYMNKEKVATEPWVYNQLAEVWNSLNDISNAAGSNADSVRRLGSKLASAVVTSMGGRKTGDGEYTIDYKNKNGGVVFSVPMTDISHGHQLKLTGTSLSMEARARDNNEGIELAHHHGITGTMSGNGTLTINWESTNFNSATGTSTIDCSSWLTARVHEIFVTYTTVKPTVDVTAYDGAGDGSATAIGDATAVLSYGGRTSTAYADNAVSDTDYWDCTASHGANIVNTGEDVRLNGTYTRYIINGTAYYR